MNFSQLQERVRLELRRRIERGTLSVSLLSRQTLLAQAHISNFLNGRRQLSIGALDKILAAQRLEVADLLPAPRDGPWGSLLPSQIGEVAQVPLVSHATALHEAYINPSSVQKTVPFLASEIHALRTRCSASRRHWERFVAVRIAETDAEPMKPLLLPEALVLLDRQYNSFQTYRQGEANLYAVRSESQLVIRYADFLSSRVVLRAHRAEYPALVVEAVGGETANDLLAGRVAMICNMPGRELGRE